MQIDISKFGKCRILVIGDLMIDEYLWGDVERISPEAPVQVVSVKNEDYTLGGSGNVVNNLVALGAHVSVLGVVGAGRNGELLMEKLKGLGVKTPGIVKESNRRTTRKTRIIAANQQVMRIDRETVQDISSRSLKAIVASAENIIPDVDVVLISDYGKGLITRPLVERLVAIAASHGKVTVADPKGLDFSKYRGVTLITPNKKEAGLAAGVEIGDDQSLKQAAERLLQTTGIEKLLITCGKEGMVFFEPDCPPLKIGTKSRQVFDVSGAGDTVVAMLGLGIASGLSFKDALTLANTAAGIVVGKVGTATVTKKELSAALRLVPDDTEDKHKDLDELQDLCRVLRKKGKQIVLTNGCFDLLHVGHIKLFSASKQLGDVLIVAIDDDDSVRKLKGSARPVIRATERVRILSALDSVDYVVVFSSQQLNKVIETIRPDVLTKGSNYQSETVYGREIVERHGGRIELVPITEEISTTRIINNIKSNQKPE